MLDQSQRTLAIELLSFNGYSIEAERLIRLDKTLWDDDQLWMNVFRTSSIGYNNDCYGTWLTRAAANGDYRTVEKLISIHKAILDKEPDMIYEKFWDHEDVNCYGPIYRSLYSDHLEIFELLLENKESFKEIPESVISKMIPSLGDSTLRYLLENGHITYEKFYDKKETRFSKNTYIENIIKDLMHLWYCYETDQQSWWPSLFILCKTLRIDPKSYIWGIYTDQQEMFMNEHINEFNKFCGCKN